MPNLPTGTVTFLFTDIEGSTQLWEEHPEAMRVAVARHDALVRAAIEQHEGYVFKTLGDAFCNRLASANVLDKDTDVAVHDDKSRGDRSRSLRGPHDARSA